jgi:Leucine-rich repeat (LRR) protein
MEFRQNTYLLILLLYFLASNFGISQCNPTNDSLELVKMYNVFDGANWTKNDNWLTPGKPISTWYGVNLNASGCVYSVVLENNQLNGAIFDINFPELIELNLNANKLHGDLLDFSKMPKLMYLSINQNQLKGVIPNFSNLRDLLSLNVSFNKLQGILPDFSQLTNITELNAAGNFLSGTIPDFKSLPELTNLILDQNEFSGNLPNFTNVNKLQYLFLYKNNFTGSIPNYSNLPGLKWLDLAENNLSGIIPNFQNLPLLEVLDVSVNQLIAIPDFQNCIKLNTLFCNKNLLQGNFPKLLACTELDKVNIGENQFTFETILDFINLRPQIELTYNGQKNFFSEKVYIAKIGESLLVDLQIDPNVLTNNYLWEKWRTPWTPPVGNSSNSNKLIFSKLSLDDFGRYQVYVTNPNAPLLGILSEEISIRVCDQSHDSSQLVNLYNLTGGPSWKNNTNWLNPGKNISTWYGIRTSSQGCVESIILPMNNLIGEIPELHFNTLDSLHLEGNLLSGTIPQFRTDFIKYLNLRNNALTGAFPQNINTFSDLENLDAGQNNLRGPIPPDLGDLSDLQSIKLDNNKIVGDLPEEISKLQQLKLNNVDFRNNEINGIKSKQLVLCPFGEVILSNNPAYSNFIDICNTTCKGDELLNLIKIPWIKDSLSKLPCGPDKDCFSVRSELGFVDIRLIKLFYIRIICCKTEDCRARTITYKFYNVIGQLIDEITCDENQQCTSFGTFKMENLKSVTFDRRWICGDTSSINTLIPYPSKFSKSNVIQCKPNPASSEVCFDVDGKLSQISIFTQTGALIQNISYQQSGNKIKLNLASLENGIYFIEAITTRSSHKGKLIVQSQ